MANTNIVQAGVLSDYQQKNPGGRGGERTRKSDGNINKVIKVIK